MRYKILTFGNVDKDFVEYLRSRMDEFIKIIDVDYVEILVFSSREYKLRFLEDEARELGVLIVGDYVTLHEAWRGWPRIHIDYEQCKNLAPKIIDALLIHELGHAYLHGSPIYYLVVPDNALISGLGSEQKYFLMVYRLATIVKDYQVHMLLLEKRVTNYLKTYALFSLQQLIEEPVDPLTMIKLLLPLHILLKHGYQIEIPSNIEDLYSQLKPCIELVEFEASRCRDISLCVNDVLSKLLNEDVCRDLIVKMEG